MYDLDTGEIPINIYLYLSKAFDTLIHDILLHKLKYYCVEDMSLQLFKSYLTNRKQYVEYDNVKSNMLNINTGVPQGSILGPHCLGVIQKCQHFHECTNSTLFQTPSPPPLQVYRPTFLVSKI